MNGKNRSGREESNAIFFIPPNNFFSICSGLHHNKENCDADKTVISLEEQLRSANEFLFPKNLTISLGQENQFQSFDPNGGWSDLRDIILCLTIVSGDGR